MREQDIKKIRKERRVKRVRGKVSVRSRLVDRPRLSVFRSNLHFYAQIIDDVQGKTLVAVSEKEISEKGAFKKSDIATALGKIIAQKAEKAGVKQVIFDKGSYKYHGRVKQFADAAREGGLQF